MRYTVEVSDKARREVAEAVGYIEQESPLNATRWLRSMEEAISSLADIPLRCPITREGTLGGEEFRQLSCGGYRVLFIIRQSTVYVAHVRHAMRDNATLDDVR
jgi:plasmid stabilization system protein ParE